MTRSFVPSARPARVLGAVIAVIAALVVPAPSASAAVAGPPTGVTATAGDGSLAVSWTAPSGVTDGVTSYVATAYDASSGGSSVGTPCSVTSPTTSCTISGLTNGTTYYVDVTVEEASTVLFTSNARVPGTPMTVPTAPSVAVVGGDTVVTVTWTPPSSDGGSPITAYVAEAYDAASGGNVASSCTPSTLTSYVCTISGLTNGTTYHVQVTATNAVGSTASARSSVSPGSYPTPPRSVTVVRGIGSLDVTWATPLSDGGSPVIDYTARAYTSSSSTTIIGSCVSTTLTCVIGGVSDTVPYYVAVTARTAVGSSQPSTRAVATVISSPTAPRSVTAVRGNGFAVVSWSPPLSTGGSKVERYIVRAYKTPAGGDPIAECSPTEYPTRCTLGPLPNGSTYYVDVIVVTVRYTSSPSEPRVSIFVGTTPSVPRDVVARQEGTGVRVTWTTPATDGGAPITQYISTAYKTSTSTTALGSCTTTGPTCVIERMDGAPVYVSVVARNSVGDSPVSTPRVKVVLVGAPTAPREVAVEFAGRVATVSWLRALDDGGVPIVDYTAALYSPTSKLLGSCVAKTPTGVIAQRVRCVVRGLPKKAMGTATVTARNAITTTASTPVTFPSATTASTGLFALPTEHALVVGAQRAVDDAERASETYIFRAWTKARGGKVAGECAYDGRAAEPGCVIKGLGNYVVYWVDAEHDGALTTRIEAKPMAFTASVPLDVTVSVRPGAATVRWQEPLSDGGYAITSYVVTARAADSQTGDTGSTSGVLGTCMAKAPKTTCTITGIASDHAYFTVMPVNPVGDGTVSAPIGRNILPA